MTDVRSQLARNVVWRRIDVQGLDACSFMQSADGYRISGTAIYLGGNETAKLEYQVSCDLDWSSQSAWVSGWIGPAAKEFSLSRVAAGRWIRDRDEISGVTGLLDIDLGFTPATNTNAIRRLGLAVGEEVETTAVWLDTDDWCFKPLTQVYRRLSETEYAYSSPSHNYAANLVTDSFGIVRLYPQLWEAVSEPTCTDKA